MARYPFGGDIASFVYDIDSDDNKPVLSGGQTVTLWSARTAGSQITDLSTDISGAEPITTVTVDDGTGTYGRGVVPIFYGPNNVTEMWASANGGPRKKMVTSAMGDVTGDKATTTVGTLAVAKGAQTFSVKDFGAIGNASGDDTAAINACIEAAPSGSVVLIPPGVYLLGPDANGHVIKVGKQNITIRGTSPRASILKIKNSAGHYTAVIGDGTLSSGGSLSGLRVENLQIDQNSAGNPTGALDANPGLFNGRPRLAVRVGVGVDGAIQNCIFVNGDSVNHILINGGASLCKRWVIENCLFDNVGNGAAHDHSTIYFHGDGVSVVKCTFRGGGAAATTAIETHGPNQLVTGNRIEHYACMANITGAATGSKNVVVSNNSGVDMGIGIQLWSYMGPGLTAPMLDNTMVIANQIEIDYDEWKTILASSYRAGIILSPGSTSVVRNCRIEGNQITYTSRSQTPSATDNQSAGIVWYRTASVTGGFADEDVEIIGNTIRDPLSAGIYIQPNFKTRRLKVTNNKVINPGKGAPNATYHVGVFLATIAFGLEDSEVSYNDVVDTQSTHSVVAAVDTQFTDTVTNCRMLNNTIRCADASIVPVHIGDPAAAAAWFMRADMKNFVVPAGVWLAGSSIVETTSGQQFSQATIPAGNNWISRAAGSAGPGNLFRAGRWYRSEGTGANITPVKNQLYFTPFWAAEPRLFDRIGIFVSTAQVDTTARLAIYGSDIHGVPTGTPKVAVQVDTASGGAKEVPIAYTLSPGLYWLACVTQGGTTQPTLRGLSAAAGQSTGVPAGESLDTATANTPRTCYVQTGVTGVLGAAADTGQASQSPAVVMRAISAATTAPDPEDPPTPPNPTPTAPVYRTSGRFLFDPQGAKVVVRGPEQNFGGGLSWINNEFVTEIGKTKSNTVRIIPHYQIDTAFGGTRNTIEDIEDQIRRGINAHMLVDFALDGGKQISSWVRPEIVALIKKYERYLVLHLKGESYESTDAAWRDVAINEIGQIRAKGVQCPVYILAREGGRRLPCILNIDSSDTQTPKRSFGQEIVDADPLHNVIFGWQAYWGMVPPTSLDYVAGGWQDNFGMSLRQAFQYCRDAPFPIQIGMIKHSDHQDPELSDLEVPYAAMMDLAKTYELGWLWWDWRMGIDDLTTDGYYPNWDGSLGSEVMVTATGSVFNSSVRTPWMLNQVAP